MDHRDNLLIKAHSALRATRALLEKILDDDADSVLSANVIGDIEESGDRNMEDKPEDRVENLRRAICEEISRRTIDLGCIKTPQQAREFCDSITGMEKPALLRELTIEYFWDLRRERPVRLPAWPRDRSKIGVLDADSRIRTEALLDILCLVQDFPSVYKQVTGYRKRYEASLARRESPTETMRRKAFAVASELCGKPEKDIAKVFDRIDWKDPVRWQEASQTGRFAVVHKFVFDDLPQPAFYRSEPKNLEDHKRRLAHSDRVRAAHLQAKALVSSLILTFESLRAEIANWHREQSVKASRKAQLEAQIARARGKLTAYDQAA